MALDGGGGSLPPSEGATFSYSNWGGRESRRRPAVRRHRLDQRQVDRARRTQTSRYLVCREIAPPPPLPPHPPPQVEAHRAAAAAASVPLLLAAAASQVGGALRLPVGTSCHLDSAFAWAKTEAARGQPLTLQLVGAGVALAAHTFDNATLCSEVSFVGDASAVLSAAGGETALRVMTGGPIVSLDGMVMRGRVEVHGGACDVVNTTFASNVATQDGGAVRCMTARSQCVFDGNRAGAAAAPCHAARRLTAASPRQPAAGGGRRAARQRRHRHTRREDSLRGQLRGHRQVAARRGEC